MMGTSYSVELITKPHIFMATWCQENCEGLWFGTDTMIHWTFELELDAVAFKLRWL